VIRKTFRPDGATLKVVDPAKGIVSGIVNSTGIVDAQRDIMVPGCWKRVATAAKNGGGKMPVICREHDWGRKVGKAIDIEELDPGDERLGPALNEQGAGGLLLTWQYNMATQPGREAFEDVKFLKDEVEFSVGFFPAENAIRYDSKGQRHISDVDRLPEVSDVLVGASVGTYAASVKSMTPEATAERKARTADRLARAEALVDGYKATRAAKAHFEMHDGKYPIDSCADVEDAWGLRNHSTTHTAAEVVRHVRHAASELGCDGPWNDGSHDENGEETGKAAEQGEQKALSHSHYHVHPDGEAHSHPHGHGAGVSEHDGPATKVPHQHSHAEPEQPAEDDEHKAMCCSDCKGQDCPGCTCGACCHGAMKTGKAGGGIPGDPPGVPYMTGDEAVHNGPLMQVLDGINTLIAQEIAEGGYTEYQDIIRLCCLAQDAISWAAGEANEYGDMGMYSIWDLFAAGRDALSSKTETPTEKPAEKTAPLPAWLTAGILATSEAELTSSHHPNPAQGEGDGLDWERRYVDGFAGTALGLHGWLQRDLHGEADPVLAPQDDQPDVTGPPQEWTDRFTSPWRQQQ
jgi:hypothetical protein